MIYSTEKDNTSEFITIKINQEILLKNKIGILEFILLKEIDKTKEHSSATFLYERFPALFNNRRNVRSTLEKLLTDGFLSKVEDKDLFSQNTYSYLLTKKGIMVVNDKEYKPKYTHDQYFRATQIIHHWNSFKQTSTHAIKPYGEIQTKTISQILSYIDDLLTGNKAEWKDTATKFTLSEIESIIEQYMFKFDPAYKPETKSGLPKSLSNFFTSYKGGHSEYFNVYKHGVLKVRTTMDDIKDLNISATVLRRAYKILSVTGEATANEKLEIQKNILRTHKKYRIQREVLLDELYSWRKIYREKITNFNTFIFEFLTFIEATTTAGSRKSGFLSFNKSNKIFEAFNKDLITKHNIHLFPTTKEILRIQKSKII